MHDHRIVFKLIEKQLSAAEKAKGKKKADGVRMNKHLVSSIKNYLDETQKQYANASSQGKQRKPTILAKHGIDYRSEDEQGRISVHGYLRELYLETGETLPEQDSKNIVAEKVADAMCLAATRYASRKFEDKIAYKLVWSLDPALKDEWVAAGVDIDRSLRRIVTRTLDKYKNAYMDGEQIGYVIGIHHDKEHFHAHVNLMDMTRSGKHLKMSNGMMINNARVDILNRIIAESNVEVTLLQEELTQAKSPIPNPKSIQTVIQHAITLAALDEKEEANSRVELNTIATTKQKINEKPDNEFIDQVTQTLQHKKELLNTLQKIPPIGQTDWRIQHKNNLEATLKEQKSKQKQLITQEKSARKKRRGIAKAKCMGSDLMYTLKKKKGPKRIYGHLRGQTDKENIDKVAKAWTRFLRKMEAEEADKQQLTDQNIGILSAIEIENLELTDSALEQLRRFMLMEADKKQQEHQANLVQLQEQEQLINAQILRNEMDLHILKSALLGQNPNKLDELDRIIKSKELHKALNTIPAIPEPLTQQQEITIEQEEPTIHQQQKHQTKKPQAPNR